MGQRPLLIYFVYNYINYHNDTVNWVYKDPLASYSMVPSFISLYYIEKVERMVLCILSHSNYQHQNLNHCRVYHMLAFEAQ